MKRWLIIALTLVVTACGGGSSSGGAGGGNNPSAGTYVGNITLTASAPGVSPQTMTLPITIEIDGGGGVRVIDEEGFFSSGSLSGNSFSITDPDLSFIEGDAVCTGTQTFTGTVGEGAVAGNYSGNLSCSGSGGSIPITFNGTFSASPARTAMSVAPRGQPHRGLLTAARRQINR